MRRRGQRCEREWLDGEAPRYRRRFGRRLLAFGATRSWKLCEGGDVVTAGRGRLAQPATPAKSARPELAPNRARTCLAHGRSGLGVESGRPALSEPSRALGVACSLPVSEVFSIP